MAAPMLQPMCTVYRCLQRNIGKFKKITHREYSRENLQMVLKKVNICLDDKVNEDLNLKKYKSKKHPGVQNIGCISIPSQLQESINNLLSNYSIKDLQKQSKNLVDYLVNRKQPAEDEEVQKQAISIEKEILPNSFDLKDVDEKKQNLYERQILKKLREIVYHWEPIHYSAYKGMLYIVGRLAPNFAVLSYIFSEIKKRDQDFNPKTLFDFGSGIGTTIWAAWSIWNKSIHEYFCVDTSDEMNTLARLLLQGGREGEDMFLKGVFFRQFLPASSAIKYNVVVSAYSLLELPSAQTRLETVSNLWEKTQDYLVIIENGTNEGFKTVLEARDFILQTSKKKESPDDDNCHVFSPCPHEHGCPRFWDGSNTPCNFEVSYNPVKFIKGVNAAKERFSYVVLKKGEQPEGPIWPRIVRPVLPRTRHVICRLCTQQGQLEDIVVTASNHGKNLYKCARASHWGDLLPVYEDKNM